MFRGRTHGQHANAIAGDVPLFSAEGALAVRPQDREIAIPIGATRGTVQDADSAAKSLPPSARKTAPYFSAPQSLIAIFGHE